MFCCYSYFIVAGRHNSREENVAKFHSQWIFFSREENFALNPNWRIIYIAKMSYTRKVRVIRYGNAKVMADCDNGSMHNHSIGSSNVISSYVSFA